MIADNANGKGMMVRGAVRKGEALLTGLLRCGHCGRRLLVSYNGTKGDVGRYNCDATRSNPGADRCISFGALRVDGAVGAEIVRLLQPLGVEAAVHAITECEHQSGENQRQLELALEQARYEAARARRQYDTVDPENRLVAGELERRWNTALAAVRALEEEMEALLRQRPPALSAEERQRLLQMGADLEAAWHHPAANAVTRKRIIRVVLREAVARVEDDQIQLLLHWQGGDHTRLTVRKNRRGQTRWSVEPETMELIRACARLMPDKAIAGLLNRTGKRTGRLNGWTQSRVRGFRNTHGISVYVNGEWAERGEVTLTEAARMLNLSPLTVLRQIRTGIVPAEQYCKGAPWVIKRGASRIRTWSSAAKVRHHQIQIRRHREEELAPPRLLLQSFHRTGAQERQLELAHRPLHAQQQPVVWMARFIGPILIDDHRANQTAKLDQRVPVPPVARQTRRLDGEHGTDAAFTDRREQPLEAWTADARTRAAKIVIDDRYFRPAESASPFGEAILTPSALMIVGKLVGGGLPDVDEGAALQMVRRDLHRFPPPQR